MLEQSLPHNTKKTRPGLAHTWQVCPRLGPEVSLTPVIAP